MMYLGYRIISSDQCLNRVLTKKQTRKFKNKRWNKKYIKMHSRMEPMKDLIISEATKTMIGHPSLISRLTAQMMDI